MIIALVLDTIVFVAAMRSDAGAAREVVRRSLTGRYRGLFGNALWMEYEDAVDRALWMDATTTAERRLILATLAQSGRWVSACAHCGC